MSMLVTRVVNNYFYHENIKQKIRLQQDFIKIVACVKRSPPALKTIEALLLLLVVLSYYYRPVIHLAA